MKTVWDSKEGKLSSITEQKIYPILLHFLYSHNLHEDMKNGIDLLFNNDVASFALRVRSPFIKIKGGESQKKSITFRYTGRSGKWEYSELYKLLYNDNMPKYGFYGFLRSDMLGIDYYTIYNIHKLQAYLRNNLDKLQTQEFLDKRVEYYYDGSSSCRFYWDNLPKDIIEVQTSWNLDLDYLVNIVKYLNVNNYTYKQKAALKKTLSILLNSIK